MLTYRDEIGGVRIEGCNAENEVEKIKSCVERLNDYERIGLTPGQVRTLIRKYRELRGSEAARTSDADVREVMEEYNRACPSLPQCRTVTDRRRVAIRTVGKVLGGKSWGEFFALAEASDFLSGRSGRWKACCFDWLMKPSNAVKVLEGVYANGTAAAAAGSFDTGEFFAAACAKSYGG